MINKIQKIDEKEKLLEAKMKMSPVVIIVFLFFAIMMFVSGIPRYLKTKEFIDRAVSTTGIIYKIEKGSRKTRAGTTKVAYYSVYTFKAKNGEQIKGKSDVPRGASDFKINDQIAILYDPKNPEYSKIKSFSDLWMHAFFFNLLGIIFIIASIFVYTQYKKYIGNQEK